MAVQNSKETLSRRLMLASCLAVLAIVGGCGAATPQTGIWLGIYDKNDRVGARWMA